jgi:hypothetical protein
MRRIVAMAAVAAMIASTGLAGPAAATPQNASVTSTVCVGPYDTVWLQVTWSGSPKQAVFFGSEFQVAGSKKTDIVSAGGSITASSGSGIVAMSWGGVVSQYQAMRGAILSKQLNVAAADTDWIPIDQSSLEANGWPPYVTGTSACP